ncbi:SH3 domain-containing protein [bacterium]|nr:SH3 domain-containing protein [bacterium]MBU1072899.1 SH3 domain-containing protein [bacterium]MBU1675946.1 SH3 domain-containing protein [bacterium]
MKKMRRWLPLLLLLLAAVAAWAAAQMLSVQVREGQLRDRPSFLGKVVADVSYGDRMTVLSSQGGWTKVRDGGGKSGWIHTSALTEKKVVLKAGDMDAATGASGEELALAGKGFNDEVEAEFKSKNPDVDYAWVDRMEMMAVSAEEAVDFLKDGGVEPKGGE